MLQTLRSTAGSWVVKILFLLLILSFGVWGIGDVTSGWTSRNAVEVGDVAIPPEQLSTEFRREVNRLRQVFGPQFTDAQAIQLGLVDQTVRQVVQRALLTQAAADIGLRVGDEAVVEQVRNVPAFQNQFGQFDPDVMRYVLRQNGFTEQSFVDQIRGDVARSQLVGAVGSGATAPEALASALFLYRGERRIADVINVPASALPEPAAPDDAALTAYHEQNSTRYTAPEFRTLMVATLSAEDLTDGISVSDEELQEAYEARSYEFITPEKRDLVQVVAADEETARRIIEATAGGQTLEDAAAAAGLETVELPETTREGLTEELVEPVFAAEVGAIGGPVESPFGWHVFTVRSVAPGGEQTLEQVREQLTADVRREKAIDQLFEVANTMDDRLASGATLPEAAEAVGANVVRLQGVDAQGRTKDGVQAEGPANLPQVLERAFTLQSGETSNLVESGESSYFAIQVENVEPPALRPLGEVRDQVIADWKAERRNEAAAAKAEELATRLREGADPADLAAELPGATYVRTEPLTREGQLTGPIAPALREKLFELGTGEVAAVPTAEGQSVARLVEIVPADPVLGAAQVAQLRTAAKDAIADDIITQYLTGLRGRYDVQENRAVIDSLFRQQE